MIVGLDSSFDRPTPAQAAAAYATGVRVWGGYIGTRDGLGLATRWTRANFDVVKQAGMVAIAYASGFDDPVAVRAMADSWGVLLGVDVEPGIRDDGPWVMPWVTAAGAGLYGLASVHYHTGEPIGRGAAWNVMANYPGFNPQATWIGGLTPPAAPHGWQWRGGHSEFGLDVDSMWLDDRFAGAFSGSTVSHQEEEMLLIDNGPTVGVWLLSGSFYVYLDDPVTLANLVAAGLKQVTIDTGTHQKLVAASAAPLSAKGTLTVGGTLTVS